MENERPFFFGSDIFDTDTGAINTRGAAYTGKWITIEISGVYGGYIPPPPPPPAPVQRRPPCAHKGLGLPCGVTMDQVRRAYRRLAKVAHPDLNPPERHGSLTRWMGAINLAYEALSAAYAEARRKESTA